MSKCGKGCMPECEYFTTGGCVSPFNCSYKVENESVTTAISAMCNLYPLETDKDREISRLKAENAELCATLSEMETVEARLDNAGKFPCKVGDTIYQTDTSGTRIFKSTVKNIIFETDGVAFDERAIGESIFLTEEAVKEKMKKLQEKNND